MLVLTHLLRITLTMLLLAATCMPLYLRPAALFSRVGQWTMLCVPLLVAVGACTRPQGGAAAFNELAHCLVKLQLPVSATGCACYVMAVSVAVQHEFGQGGTLPVPD